MNENRDFIIERLERQLKEKETELEDIKNTLRDSILREIRSDLKSDFDINNRIASLEHKIQALTSNLNGVMDELLDQKSMIRSLSELSVPRARKEEIKPSEPAQKVNERPVEKAAERMEPRLYRPEPEPEMAAPRATPPDAPIITAPVRQFVPPQPSIPANRANISVRSTEQTRNDPRNAARPANMRLNIREVAPPAEPLPPQRPEPRSEYIVAETDDERQLRKARSEPRSSSSCDYIVAEDKNTAKRRQAETEYEQVESRDDEDAVITVTRRK